MKKTIMSAFFVVLLSGPALAAGAMPGSGSSAQNEWIREFNDVCQATTASMALSKSQLKTRIGLADALKTQLGCLEDSARKVYTTRLRMCHDMYGFALKVKEKENGGK